MRKNKSKNTVADYLEVLTQVQTDEAEDVVDSVIKNANIHYEPKVHMRQVLVHMAQGKTVLETAYDMGFSVLTLNLWRREHEDFDMVVNIGKSLAEAWWQKQGRENIRNPYFNQALWMMNMSNRYSWSRRLDGIVRTVIDDEMERYENTKERYKKEDRYQGNIKSSEVGSILQIIEESRAQEIKVENQEKTKALPASPKSKRVRGVKVKMDKLHTRGKGANT